VTRVIKSLSVNAQWVRQKYKTNKKNIETAAQTDEIKKRGINKVCAQNNT